ncbi:MAG: SRPBCC family protein [Acidimicrobiales bacterium]|nr:SRPBCC family protein [Acidimicrobiales bacterium]
MPEPEVREQRVVSVSRLIPAPARDIFSILSDASRHALIDGSGTVRGTRDAKPEPLELGAKFGMRMKMGVPYPITNTVVEYEQDRLIAWRHFGRHIWRYELTPVEGGTEVVESFDWSKALWPKGIELAGYPTKHPPAMERTLERLEEVVSTSSTG